MKWKKIGRIFCPNGKIDWMKSHASVPIAEHIEDDLYKIYFSSRDRKNRSYTGYLLIDIKDPCYVLEISDKPILSPGNLGEFDDSGTMASWLSKKGEKRFLYYIGWNLGVTVPFRNSIGLAISQNGEEFSRYAPGPIVDRTLHEPHFTASCCVLAESDIWRMWYLSCTDWKIINNIPIHRYHIKYAESEDGIYWKRNSLVAIDFENDNEYAISRPSVIRDPDVWRMWYSYRGESYRIGYAESYDGKIWERHDNLSGIDVSVGEWDSEMIEYPYVFDHEGTRYLLYNGNGYGRSGFGLAILEKE